jgi:hypothetical protein
MSDVDQSEFVASAEKADIFFEKAASDCSSEKAKDGDHRDDGIRFHPFIRTVQKIVLYETRSVK